MIVIKRSLFLVIISFIACKGLQPEKEGSAKSAKLQTIHIHQDSLVLVPEQGLVYYKSTPFSGTALGFYENGQKASHIEYIQGKKHGLYKRWHTNALLRFESNYVDGKKHGQSKSWWQNGNLRAVSNFEHGVAHGFQKSYYKSGAKFKQVQLVNGKEEGLQQSWRENGKLYNNYEARNGRIFGLKRSNLCYELESEEIQYKD